MARIAIAGLQHETNTFAPSVADLAAFEDGGGWPGICHGAEIFEKVGGANIPIEGAIQALMAQGHELVPLTWAAASPSAHVTDHAFDTIVRSIIERLQAALPVDGIVLDLHGAMVTQSYQDGEGELLRRIRRVVGSRTPIVASLDSHANVTHAMVELTDALSAYRTYPHLDMAATGARAAHLLMRMIQRQERLPKRFHKFDFLTGIASQCTLIEPAASLYASLEQLEHHEPIALSLTPGFPMADIAECGMGLLGYALSTDGAPRLQIAFDHMKRLVEQAEPLFAQDLLEPEQAVERAIRKGRPGAPVVLADTQDNPGAGGDGDTTDLLRCLMAQRATNAVLGLLVDPQAAQQAHTMGVGARGVFRLGAHSGFPGVQPVQAEFDVIALGDGRLTCTGPMFNGFRMQLGAMAVIRHGGVRVVLVSSKCQAADQAMFRHVGIEPSSASILALKSSVHFRNDFQRLAQEVLLVRAPGPALADPAEFSWRHLRPGVRLRPLGAPFSPSLATP
jgi:microcystin degradation protein MlrC